MKCQKCDSERILEVQTGVEECSYTYDGEEYECVAPIIDNVSDGLYVDIALCLDCGQVQGEFPAEDPDFDEEEDEEDEDNF